MRSQVRVGEQAGDLWGAVLDAGASIGDWWESTTADLGAWVDEEGAGVRDLIGRHVAVVRFAATAARVVGWAVTAVGGLLTVALAALGATGGLAFGGVGAAPGGAAGAAAGASIGMKFVGVGLTLVSVGEFLDVAADWGEGTIDGQDLVQRGAVELGFGLTAFAGSRLIGKGLQKLVEHLPASVRSRVDELLATAFRRAGPLDEAGMLAPLRSTAATGAGWSRIGDTNPDPLYALPRADHGVGLNAWSQAPGVVDPGVAGIGGSLDDVWGTNPVTGSAFTEAEWAERYVEASGGVRWPPNDGAVPGTRVVFDDPAAFLETYGEQFDRIGDPGGAYLGVPPGAAFEARSLPPGHLSKALHEYSFTGYLPSGVTIEVSEIAPAFGRPGGGIQVRFMNGGTPILIRDLAKDGKYEGVLR